MRTIRLTASLVFAALALALTVGFTQAQTTKAPAPDPEKDKERTEVRKMAQDTLNRLYKAQPSAQAAVKKSAGYAVFSNTGVKILLAGSGKGQGVAVNSKTRKETFMRMLELQAGLGVGVKKFQVVFVFDNENAFNSFVNSGWEFGGQTTAAAKAGDKGADFTGATSVSEGVWMYQLTDKGLALEITGKGTKYSKDDDLN
jgi:lipid-binding SYLF domain-containing protein